MSTVPVAGSTFTFGVGLVSQADTRLLQANPTIAAGDFQRSVNGGAFGNLTNLPTVTPAGGTRVEIVLSAAETTAAGAGGEIWVRWIDAAGAEWCDGYTSLRVHTAELDTPDIADAVWDEVLTSGTHDVGYSAGQRLRYMILTGAVAQGGTANSITLAATESATDNIFNENIISIVDGTGAGQTRLIAEYDGTTKIAKVDKAWFTNPAVGSVYEILPFSSILVANHGTAQAGAAGSITLAAGASAVDNAYIGSVVYLSTGTGAGQVRLITDYDGTSKIATISDNWTTTPDNTSVYKVLPVGRTIVDSMSADAAEDVWTHTPRTLTQSATSIASAVAGGTVTIHRGDSLSASITGLGDISARTKLWFTVKRNPADVDTASIIQIEETAGLVYLNGAAGVALSGDITVDDAVAGDITITMDETATDDLVPKTGYYYDIQMLTATDVTTLSAGPCNVTADITRAVT